MSNKITGFLIIFTFVLFSFGQLGRISFLNQEVNLYAYDVVLALTFLIFLFKYHLKPIRLAFKKNKVIYLFIGSLFLSFILQLLQFNLSQNIVSFLYFARFVSYIMYFLYLYFYLKKGNNKILSISIRTFFIITITSSLIQYIFYFDLQNLVYLGWDPHYHRMFGTFFDTSSAAAIYGLTFLYALIPLFKIKKRNIADFIYPFIFFMFLILTFSRSSYIGLAISILYLFSAKKIVRYTILILGLFLIIFLVSPKQFGQGVGLNRTFSISSRIFDYQEGIQIWSKNPILGIGYNRIRYVRERMNLLGQIQVPSHAAASLSSSYIVILICGGVVGLLLFIASIVRLIRINKNIAVLVIFISVLSFFDNIFLHPFVLFLLGSFICSINLSYTSRK